MSSTINSKDIIIKQKEKYKDSNWSEFLLEEFDKDHFKRLLEYLISNMEKGVKFHPPIKNWFDNLLNLSLDDINVVIINNDNALTLGNNFKTFEELSQQGVLFYPLAKTIEDHDYWYQFNLNFIKYLKKNKPGITYIFIGDDVLDFTSIPSDQNFKIFMPELTNKLWDKETVKKLFNTNVNNLTKTTIEWF